MEFFVYGVLAIITLVNVTCYFYLKPYLRIKSKGKFEEISLFVTHFIPIFNVLYTIFYISEIFNHVIKANQVLKCSNCDTYSKEFYWGSYSWLFKERQCPNCGELSKFSRENGTKNFDYFSKDIPYMGKITVFKVVSRILSRKKEEKIALKEKREQDKIKEFKYMKKVEMEQIENLNKLKEK